jgi:hypothetical protein
MFVNKEDGIPKDKIVGNSINGFILVIHICLIVAQKCKPDYMNEWLIPIWSAVQYIAIHPWMPD